MSDLSRRGREIKEGGQPLVVGISGGKDSMAMALYLIEHKFYETNEIFWCYTDTKWEHPEIYNYLKEVAEPELSPYGEFRYLVSEKYPGGMVDMVRDKGFASRTARFCTLELKIKPIKKMLKDLREQGHEPINVVGVRAQESLRRSQMDEFDIGGPIGVPTWRPLISWLIEEVIEQHQKFGILPCSLYYKTKNPVKRVGCWPCLMSSKEEIRGFAEDDPEKVQVIRDLEEEVGEFVQIRPKKSREEKGETHDPENVLGATFFMASKKPYLRTIDQAIDWAKTARGGIQYQLFTPQNPQEFGCQLWGLCDMAHEDEG